MNTKEKNINNPKTIDALKHLDEMHQNAKISLVEGKPLIIIQTIDVGDNFLQQDLFNEVHNDTIVSFLNYVNKTTSKLFR